MACRGGAAAQVGELDAFTCHADRVYNTYKYKLVRAAFANLPTKDSGNQIKSKARCPVGPAMSAGRTPPSSSAPQVTVDSQGLARITHMGIAGQGSFASPGQPGAVAQRAAKSWVQFMVLPEDASVEEDD